MSDLAWQSLATMCRALFELAVSGQREPAANHLAAGDLHRRRAGVGGEVVGLGREAHHTLPTVPMIFAASMGPTPKISVRVVPEASTSASMRPFLGPRSFCP